MSSIFVKRLSSLLPKCYRHFHSTCKGNQKWQLASAVCVERYPVVSALPNETELKLEKFFLQIEKEKSHQSDYEVMQTEDRKLAKLRKSEDFEETEADATRLTAFELEDQWNAEANAFTPASRITEADEKNDLRSTDRKLDSKLLLLVKQRVGNKSDWGFPISIRKEGESMREAAEQNLNDLLGDQIKVRFMGNAPYGFYKYKHPNSPAEDGATGTKVFIFKAQLVNGQVQLSAASSDSETDSSGDSSSDSDEENSLVSDFMWVTKDELKQYIDPKTYRVANSFVLDFKPISVSSDKEEKE